METWTYDVYNNVRSYTDAEVPGNTTDYYYYEENPNDYPTLLIKIVEPEAGTPPAQAETILSYYLDDPDALASQGQLKQVTDPNGVVTVFEYDRWGQLAMYGEGVPDPALDPVYYCNYTPNGGGWVKATNCHSGGGLRAGVSCGQGFYFLNGRRKSMSCCAVGGPSPPTRSSGSFPQLPSGPLLPQPYADFSMNEDDYNGRGQVLDMNLVLTRKETETFYRDFDMQYDERGRVTIRSIDSSREAAPSGPGRDFTRLFSFIHDDALGQYSRVGPDGMETLVQLDAANRAEHVRRGTQGAAEIEYDITRYANGLMSELRPSGLADHKRFYYNAANRLTSATHYGDWGEYHTVVFDYEYNNRGLLIFRSETFIDDIGMADLLAYKVYDYDDRNRLIRGNRSAVCNGLIG